jgi:hypothetical protein
VVVFYSLHFSIYPWPRKITINEKNRPLDTINIKQLEMKSNELLHMTAETAGGFPPVPGRYARLPRPNTGYERVNTKWAHAPSAVMR